MFWRSFVLSAHANSITKNQPPREAEGSEESERVDHFLSIFLENVLKQGCNVCHGSKELLSGHFENHTVNPWELTAKES